jgi:hypothetical protein
MVECDIACVLLSDWSRVYATAHISLPIRMRVHVVAIVILRVDRSSTYPGVGLFGSSYGVMHHCP